MSWSDDDDIQVSRLDELLIDEALVGLSPAEHDELERLLAENPRADRQAFGLLAARLDVAELRPQAMPAGLRLRITADAAARVPQVASPIVNSPGRAAMPAPPILPLAATADLPAAARRQATQPLWLGWVVAAGLLVGFFIAPPQAGRPIMPEHVLASTEQAVRWDWQPTNGTACDGYVVFSPKHQQGILVMNGLPPTDGGQWQYQIWIIDKSRDEPHPVDGGVFDVCADHPNEPCVVSFHAKLPVRHPVKFALTKEPHGGVVVSDQDELVAVAGTGE
jgi:hypothetical protein